MTTTTPAVPVPTLIGLVTVTDHFAAVFARPAPVPRRLDVPWTLIQPSNPTGASPGQNDTWDPTLLDTIATKAIANGITHLCLCLTYVSQAWAGGGGAGHQVPRDPDNGCRDLANIRRLAGKYMLDTYPGLTVYWELWNEPQNGFMGPVNLALRSTYIKILQACADAVRNGNIVGRVGVLPHATSGADLWTGGTGAGPAPNSNFGHYGWHAAIIDADPNCFDHIAIHAYSGPCPVGSNNSYDGLTNGAIPLRTHLDAAGRTDACISSTEGGWFWRDDGTPTNTSSDCSAYGTAQGGNANLTIEVDVTTMAARITAAGAKWQQKAAANKLGIYFLYQQDTTAPNNTDETTGGGASAAFNHAGLYTYSASRNGTATLDGSGNPTPLNAFLGLLSTPGAPTISFMAPADSSTVSGDFALAISAHASPPVESDDAALTVVLSADDGATFPFALAHMPSGEPFGFNRLFQGHSTDGSWPDGTYHFKAKATNPTGQSTTTPRFTLVIHNVAGVPVISSVTPATGPPAGGTHVVIAGVGFTGVSGADGVKVQIPNGPVANATSYTVISDTEIDAVMPPVPTQTDAGPPPILIDCGANLPPNSLMDLFRDWGGAGSRVSANWDTLNPSHDGHTFSQNYLTRLETIIKHCNGLTLLSGVTPAAGVDRFEIDLQLGSGSTFGSSGTGGTGEMYNENAVRGSTHYNVPKLFAEAAANLAIHFKAGSGNGELYALELANEPNHQKWDNGDRSGVDNDHKGFAYVKCFAHFSRLARAGGATSILLLGGLGGQADSATGDISAYHFTAQCYQAAVTAGQSYDGVAIPNGIKGLVDRWNNHPYCYFNTPEQDIANALAGQNYRGWADMVGPGNVPGVWTILDSNGDGALLADATEFGQPHDDTHSLADALVSLTSAVRLWKTYSHAGALYLFQGVDNPGFKQNGIPHRLYGIFDVHLNPNQPYAQGFKDLATGVVVP